MNATTEKKLSVWAPKVPGVEPTIVGWADTVTEAREIAAEYGRRRDLRMQDIVIRLGRDGKIIERAGPCR